MVMNKTPTASMASLIVIGATPELDKIVDVVLNYRPKSRAKKAKRRNKRKAKKNV
jgi:hypothetical protein